MLSIDQVQLLEDKVSRAVGLINSLSSERDSLKKIISEKEERISELENLILAFKEDQSEIEEKIVNALNQLSMFEDSVNSKIEQTQQNMSESIDNKKIEDLDESKKNDLQKDLDDVLGTSIEDDISEDTVKSQKVNPENLEVDKQLDIF